MKIVLILLILTSFTRINGQTELFKYYDEMKTLVCLQLFFRAMNSNYDTISQFTEENEKILEKIFGSTLYLCFYLMPVEVAEIYLTKESGIEDIDFFPEFQEVGEEFKFEDFAQIKYPHINLPLTQEENDFLKGSDEYFEKLFDQWGRIAEECDQIPSPYQREQGMGYHWYLEILSMNIDNINNNMDLCSSIAYEYIIQSPEILNKHLKFFKNPKYKLIEVERLVGKLLTNCIEHFTVPTIFSGPIQKDFLLYRVGEQMREYINQAHESTPHLDKNLEGILKLSNQYFPNFIQKILNETTEFSIELEISNDSKSYKQFAYFIYQILNANLLEIDSCAVSTMQVLQTAIFNPNFEFALKLRSLSLQNSGKLITILNKVGFLIFEQCLLQKDQEDLLMELELLELDEEDEDRFELSNWELKLLSKANPIWKSLAQRYGIEITHDNQYDWIPGFFEPIYEEVLFILSHACLNIAQNEMNSQEAIVQFYFFQGYEANKGKNKLWILLYSACMKSISVQASTNYLLNSDYEQLIHETGKLPVDYQSFSNYDLEDLAECYEYEAFEENILQTYKYLQSKYSSDELREKYKKAYSQESLE
jgi:hypothetical protein